MLNATGPAQKRHRQRRPDRKIVWPRPLPFLFGPTESIQPPGLFQQPFVNGNLPQSNALCNREKHRENRFYKRMSMNCGGGVSYYPTAERLAEASRRAGRRLLRPGGSARFGSGIAGELGAAAKIASNSVIWYPRSAQTAGKSRHTCGEICRFVMEM